MGVITPDNGNIFKSASIIYANVKRDLSSFDSAGMIDEGEFPRYIKHVLKRLGLGVYKEADAVAGVNNYKAGLPEDFAQLYAAYKCTPYFNQKDMVHQQGAPISVYNDVTWELLQNNSNCEIAVEECQTQILERITVKQYVKEQAVTVGFSNFVPLKLSPNVKREFIGDDCMNVGWSSPFEISITNNILYTNFSKDYVYLKYYAFPKDENGVPMIPDIEEVEKAVEWYIKYEILMGMWMNNSVPDLQNRWQYAKEQYDAWHAEAKYYLKLPSFVQMVNSIRRQRHTNKIAIFYK